jgi:Na+-driven multidrug efflux pump
MGKKLFVAVTSLAGTLLAALATWLILQAFQTPSPGLWIYTISGAVIALGISFWAGPRLWDDKQELLRRDKEQLSDERQ